MASNAENAPTIAVLGVGAVGGTVAAALGDAGHRPTLLKRTGDGRLRRTLGTQTAEYDLPVLTDPTTAPPFDVLLLCTKAYQSDAAAAWFARSVSPVTTVAVLQNGVDQVERLSAHVPAEQIVPVVVQMACERTGPCDVAQTRPGRLYVPDIPRGRQFAALFDDGAALAACVQPDFVSALWRKLALNATSGAIGALTLRPNGVMAEPAVQSAARALMAEAMAVGRAEGASFPEDYVEQTLETLAGPVRGHWSSLAADRRDGRPLEWQVRNAVIGRIGARHGIATPLNDLVSALLEAASPNRLPLAEP